MKQNNNIISDKIILNDLDFYFNEIEEFTEFYETIKDKWLELKNKNYTDIIFNIDIDYYTEYGDDLTDVQYSFTFERELTYEELEQEQKFLGNSEENDKIFSELCGKLSTNTIGAIIQNDELKALYLNGQIKI